MTEAAHPLIGRTFTDEERVNLNLPPMLVLSVAGAGELRQVHYDLVRADGQRPRFRYEKKGPLLIETREALRTILDLYMGVVLESQLYSPRAIRLSEPVQNARRLLNLPPFTGDEL